jgi:hypothetical protein
VACRGIGWFNGWLDTVASSTAGRFRLDVSVVDANLFARALSTRQSSVCVAPAIENGAPRPLRRPTRQSVIVCGKAAVRDSK